MTDLPNIPSDLIQTVYFDITHQQFVDLVNPYTKLGVYTNQTLNELAIEYKAQIVEMDRMRALHLQSLPHITPVSETSEDYFYEMLEVLPPCAWRRSYDFEHFYLSEHVYENIVLHLVRAGNHFFKFQDYSRLDVPTIRMRVDAFFAFSAIATPEGQSQSEQCSAHCI